METKGPRPITNSAFVIILAVTLLGAMYFTWDLVRYAVDGTVG